MATKKKSSEAVDGVFSVASEDFSIAWGGAIYNFIAGNPVVVPAGLLDYLAKSGKLSPVYTDSPVVVEEEAVDVVEASEELTEEVL